MGDVLSLLAPFFSTPTNYSQVLQRLAGAIFWEVYLLSFFLRDIPKVDHAMREIETYGSLGKLFGVIPNSDVLNISGFLLAVIAARVCYVVQLHDRLSDFFKIRARFDKAHILVPLANLVGSQLSGSQLSALDVHRDKLMHAVFYRYASSRDENPLVDKHDIEHALSAWSSFWMYVEGMVVVGVFGLLVLIFNDAALFGWLLLTGVALFVLAVTQHHRLPSYSKPQIEAIARNDEAAKQVKASFDAL